MTNSTRDALSAGRSLSSRDNPPSINRDDIAARIKSLQANQGVTSRSDLKSNPPSLSSRTLPPSLRNVPTETNNRTPRDIGKHADTTPYRSLFKPNTDPPHGNFARHDSRSGGGRHNDPIRVGPDHRGAPHGTPRHDAGMHGHTTYHHKPYYPYYGSHQRHPGHFYFGRYGYGYRGSGLSIYLGYLGSPWYGSTTSYYYEPYYVPYYVPYTVPYVVQTEPYLVETEVVEPAAAVAVAGVIKLVRNGVIKPNEIIVINCSGHTMPIESRILGEGWGPVDVNALEESPEEGLLSAITHISPERFPRVAIVDDNADARRLIRRILQSQGEYTIYEAGDGMEAVELITTKLPDLVLLDLMMPELDGFAVMDILQKKKETADIPIIVVTAKELTIAEKKRLDGHIQTLLQKGNFLSDDLENEVRSLLK